MWAKIIVIMKDFQLFLESKCSLCGLLYFHHLMVKPVDNSGLEPQQNNYICKWRIAQGLAD